MFAYGGAREVDQVAFARHADQTEIAGAAPDVADQHDLAIEELLASGRIDIGLFYTGAVDIHRGDIPLTVSHLYLIGPHGDTLTAEESVTLAEVTQCDLILPSRPGGVRAIVENASSKIGLRLRIPCEIDSLLALKEVVSTGVGHTVCSFDAVAADVRAGRLQVALIREPELTRTLVMNLMAKHALTIAARAVAELVPSATQALINEGHWQPIKSSDGHHFDDSAPADWSLAQDASISRSIDAPH